MRIKIAIWKCRRTTEIRNQENVLDYAVTIMISTPNKIIGVPIQDIIRLPKTQKPVHPAFVSVRAALPR